MCRDLEGNQELFALGMWIISTLNTIPALEGQLCASDSSFCISCPELSVREPAAEHVPAKIRARLSNAEGSDL